MTLRTLVVFVVVPIPKLPGTIVLPELSNSFNDLAISPPSLYWLTTILSAVGEPGLSPTAISNCDGGVLSLVELKRINAKSVFASQRR